MSRAVHWVIPCYNEEHRLDATELAALVADGAHATLVDDGSTDATGVLIQRLAQQHARVHALPLPHNQGKAEAVRHGLNQVMSGVDVVGFLDADFATNASEAKRLVGKIEDSNYRVVLGSRWRHLGADIDRSPLRHYGGRVFATLASFALDLPIYDTQCGAKLFVVDDVLRDSLTQPFTMDFAFDVELLNRLLGRGILPSEILEVPLSAWRDVGTSKVRPRHAVKAFWSVGKLAATRIWFRERRRDEAS